MADSGNRGQPTAPSHHNTIARVLPVESWESRQATLGHWILGPVVLLHRVHRVHLSPNPKNYVSMSLPHSVATTRRSSPAWLFLSSNIISIQQDGSPIAFFVNPFHPSSISFRTLALVALILSSIGILLLSCPRSHVLAPGRLCRRFIDITAATHPSSHIQKQPPLFCPQLSRNRGGLVVSIGLGSIHWALIR